MARWEFQHWDNGETTVQRSLNVLSDVTLTATYVEGFILSVMSTPNSPVNFKINNASVVTPFNQVLQTGQYTIEMPASIAATGGSYNFQHWDDNTTNPIKTINLTAATSLVATYLYSATPPPKGTLEVNATKNGSAVSASGTVSPGGIIFDATPYNTQLDLGDYIVTCTFEAVTKTQSAHIASSQTTTLTFDFTPAKGTLTINATKDGGAVIGSGFIEGGPSFGQTPFSVDLDPSNYDVTCTYQGAAKTQTATITSGQTTTLTFDFSVKIAGFPWWLVGVGLAIPVVGYIITRKGR